ncbi:3-isopropylmalate dehydratase small subunit [Halorubrum sp. AJ67]|nr:3-isopropylmalate dehydratase small subunit [Halorubrum sp. AJ67]
MSDPDERYDGDLLPEFLQSLVARGRLKPYMRASLDTE